MESLYLVDCLSAIITLNLSAINTLSLSAIITLKFIFFHNKNEKKILKNKNYEKL